MSEKPKAVIGLRPQMTLESLQGLLSDAKIDFTKWGDTQGSKPVINLLSDIQKRDCLLVINPEGQLLRKVQQVGIFVFACDGDGQFHLLREDQQIFKKNGKIKKRNLGEVSLREKVSLLEGYSLAMWRGLKEELPSIYAAFEKIDPIIRFGRVLNVDTYNPPSNLSDELQSYPGLPTETMQYRYTLIIPRAAFRRKGYVTNEQDKITYFKWERVNSNNPFLPATRWQRMRRIKKIEAITSNSLLFPSLRFEQIVNLTEYLILKSRLEELALTRHQSSFGSPEELEYTATVYRLEELKESFKRSLCH